MRSMMSSDDSHDNQLRQLLDQRSARANSHRRYSEELDTPSVYSNNFFSPTSLERPDFNANSNTFVNDYRRPRQMSDTRSRSPTSDRYRLNNDPTVSALDLEDDPRASYESTDFNAEERFQHLLDNDDSQEAIETEDSRMSLLGPKMRFHSRAPWENAEGGILEDDEFDSDSGSGSPSVGSGSKRGRMAEGLKKGLGLGSSKRAPGAARPSNESSRSQTMPKRSFESGSSNISPYGIIMHAQAQASMSSTSLSLPPHSHSSEQKRGFPFARTLTTPANYNNPYPSQGSSRPAVPFYDANTSSSSKGGHSNFHSSPRSFQDNPVQRRSSESRASSYSREEEGHPYANPSLMESYGPTSPLSPTRDKFEFPSKFPRSDSSVTVTAYNDKPHSGATSSLSPKLSSLKFPRRDMDSGNRPLAFQGKEISSPISIVTSGLLVSDTPNLQKSQAPEFQVRHGVPVWHENPASPLTLISLEEAQAKRSRTITSQSSVSQTSGSNNDSSRLPFPDSEQSSGVNPGSNHSPSGMPQRQRTRSISTGARAKHALHSLVSGASTPKPERSDSEPTVPSQPSGNASAGTRPPLKHKRSGLMKLFSGRDKEKEKDIPPPVPTLSEAYNVRNAQQAATKSAKVTSHRIPVPQLSPSISPNSTNHSDNTILSKPSPTQKRTPPPLTLNTSSFISRAPASAAPAGPQYEHHHDLAAPPRLGPEGAVSSSAPANVTDFLSLRPVSTQFSAQFGDHLDRRGSEPSLDADVDTESSMSPGGALTPRSPDPAFRSDPMENAKPSGVLQSDDQSAVIQALQEQIVSAKKAWQWQIWELEGQVRDLKAEIEDLRMLGDDQDVCGLCGRGGSDAAARKRDGQTHEDGCEGGKQRVVNRPRIRTGAGSSRFGNGN